MLIIRKEQMDVLEQHAKMQFEDRMLVHLRQHFPSTCQANPEEEIRETIRYGCDRARAYDIRSEREVCKYIDLMFTFGADFDVDPDLPWAARILNRKHQAGSATKMDNLFKEALNHTNAKEAGAHGTRS